MRITELVLMVILIFHFSGCKKYSGDQGIIVPKIAENFAFEVEKIENEQYDITGEFVSVDHQKNDENLEKLLTISRKDCEKLQLIASSGKDKKKSARNFRAIFYKKKDNVYTAMINGKKILLISRKNKLSIKPEKPEGLGVLPLSWSWGTSLLGNYKKIEGSLGGR